ncbi:UNVERIFIED_CONTAM: hypothetical protein GTU68_016343, partial [Idotea baltica]|nr:hypothetical protein [Idotea baltica]
MSAANNGALGFTGLTSGAANLIVSFGSDEQKEIYLPKMYGGEWQGTMALTEPQAGSSLSDVITTATPHGEDTYKIKGQKIYISGGDFEGIDNVVHMLLARIEGAPKGTKGISLFIVPKYRVDENNERVFNDVTVAGLYHKMGQKGTPATHLMMGESDDCIGYLLGEPHQGLKYMFQMMNEARIMEGTTGIQSQDLLGRKVTMMQGKAIKLFFKAVAASVERANTHEELRKYGQQLSSGLQKLQEVTMHLVGIAMKGEIERFLSDATLYMEMFGIITISWQWLKQATIAKEAMLTNNPQGDDLTFYESKIHTMKFYFAYELPKIQGLSTRLMD